MAFLPSGAETKSWDSDERTRVGRRVPSDRGRGESDREEVDHDFRPVEAGKSAESFPLLEPPLGAGLVVGAAGSPSPFVDAGFGLAGAFVDVGSSLSSFTEAGGTTGTLI